MGFTGRLVREKGLVELLEAATELADRFPQLWILLVGERLVSDHAEGCGEAPCGSSQYFSVLD